MLTKIFTQPQRKHSMLWLAIIMMVVCSFNWNSVRAQNEAGQNLYVVINKDGKLGYINDKGNVVIEPKYIRAYEFSDGYAMVQKDDYWCSTVINTKGEETDLGQYNVGVTDPHFHEGKLRALFGNDKWGFICFSNNYYPTINSYGNAYDNLKNYHEGMAAFMINDKWGFINEWEDVVVEPIYDFVLDFSDGIALVKKDSEWLYIYKNGQIFMKPQGSYCQSFHEGMAFTYINNKFGYYGMNGKIIIEPQFDNAFWFNHGLAAVKINGEWGFINKSGRIIIQPSSHYEEVHNFQNDRALIKYYNGKWGYIDREGRLAIGPEYDFALDFYENRAIVQVNGKYGVIDEQGKFVIQPIYDNFYTPDRYKYYYGILDPYFGILPGGMVLMLKGDKAQYINKDGKIIYEFSDTNGYFFGDKY